MLACEGVAVPSGPASASPSPQQGACRAVAAPAPADSSGSGSRGRKWRALVMMLIKSAGLSAGTDPAHQRAGKSAAQRDSSPGSLQ